MQGTDTDNEYFRLATAFVNHTGQHIFLTGKAGTGKTTFLKYIQTTTFKKTAVVAPTGVAAINAGGVTLHSLFQLPFGCFIPVTHSGWNVNAVNRQGLLQKVRLNSAKRELLQELELLVIDEVSMVRADLLDAVDTLLRHYRQQPDRAFGGVQVLFIGDLFQLPPVADTTAWEILAPYYKSPFFFDAQVLQENPPVCIELKKIYRQRDIGFIDLLNHIRNNVADKTDLNALNALYQPGYQPREDEHYITLTTHNVRADAINQSRLKQLPGQTRDFKAVIKKDFSEKAYPADEVLQLREGAQIMFIKNDKGEVRRYYNGKIATITKLTDEKIMVTFPGEKEEMAVELETWSNIRYQYNRDTDQLEEEEQGSFTQYPIRLAWAITIHKSQGLTFDKAIIDAGDAFAPGQVYVALSRLTGLDGLVLYSRILPQSISTDKRVIEYTETHVQDTETLRRILQQEQERYIQESLIRNFGWQKIRHEALAFHDAYESRTLPDKVDAVIWSKALLLAITNQGEIASRFKQQLSLLLQTAKADQYRQLQERVTAAKDYFHQLLDKSITEVELHMNAWKNKQRTKRYIGELKALTLLLTRKQQQLKQAEAIATGLQQGVAPFELLEQVDALRQSAISPEAGAENAAKPTKLPKGETKRISFALFKEGKTIEDIATERGMVKSTIAGHLAEFVKTGELDITSLLPAERIAVILNTISIADGEVSLNAIREKLNNEYDFGEIRLVLSYHQWQSGLKTPATGLT